MLRSSNRNLVHKNDEEGMKHMCKSCNKSFPCGRSLGGHMRSHVINPSDHNQQKMKSSSLNDNGGNLMNNSNNTEAINSNDLGYELRKDPKKTLKAVINGTSDSNDFLVPDKICKECGKGFQSWKALFGHMKCHSVKVSNTKTMIFNPVSCTSQRETENSALKICQMRKSRSRKGATNKSIVTNPIAPANTASSSASMNPNHATTSVVSDIFDDEDEEVAMCLIMLSRDMGKWDQKNIKNGCKVKKLDKMKSNQEEFDHQSKRKFHCTSCNKSFRSYQALGGHNASHKKLKVYFDYEAINKDAIKGEPVLDHDKMSNGCCEKTYENLQPSSSFNLGGSLKKNMAVVGAYECSICLEIFTSGQALGGHKRSHLIREAQQNLNLIEKVTKPVHEVRGFLDLNLPPDDHVEEEDQETMMMNASFMGTQETLWRYNHESTLLGLFTTN